MILWFLVTCSDNFLSLTNFSSIFVMQDCKKQLGFILGLFFGASLSMQNSPKSPELLSVALCIMYSSWSFSFHITSSLRQRLLCSLHLGSMCYICSLPFLKYKKIPGTWGKQLKYMPTWVRATGNSNLKPARLIGNWPDGSSCKLKGLIIWGSCLESRRDECNILFLVTTVSALGNEEWPGIQ